MNITGAVKVIDVPDDACLTTVRDLLLSLQKYLAVEFGVERITNVAVSSDEPGDMDRDMVWFRLDNAGNFLGIFVFVQGSWVQMFPPPGALYKIVGDSASPPDGYALVTNLLPQFTDAMVAKLQQEWVPAPNGIDYRIFHVVYVGL